MSTEYQNALLMCFCFIIIHHEVGHILHGHLLIDRDLESIMEYDADCFAMSTITRDTILSLYVEKSIDPFLSVKLLIQSLVFFCSLFVDLNEKKEVKKISHPSSVIRLWYMYSTLKGIVSGEDEKFDFQKLESELYPYFIFFIKKFTNISYENDDILYFRKEIEQSYRECYYRNLKSEVEQNAYLKAKYIDVIYKNVKDEIKNGSF